jgi:hypothetical protein
MVGPLSLQHLERLDALSLILKRSDAAEKGIPASTYALVRLDPPPLEPAY